MVRQVNEDNYSLNNNSFFFSSGILIRSFKPRARVKDSVSPRAMGKR